MTPGYVGEVGRPDAASGDAGKWNDLADRWFEQADRVGLWVTAWATGEWWGRSYDLSVYENRKGDSESGVDSANTQAPVFESHTSGLGYGRGVTVNGGEFGSPITKRTSKFSNKNPGRYQTRYHYDWQHTFDYLGRRGFDHALLGPQLLGRILKKLRVRGRLGREERLLAVECHKTRT